MKTKEILPDWMIEQIEREKRQREQERQRPQLEIPVPDLDHRKEPEKEERKGGVIEIQVWSNDD